MPFKVTPVFKNPRKTSETRFLVSPNSSCFNFSFISSIVAKRFPFIGVFSFMKRKKSAGPSPVTKVVEAWLRFCFWPKTHAQSSMLRYHGAWSMIGFPQSCTFLKNFFAHNFKIVFLIDRTTLWQEFRMHYAIAIEENKEQNLHIWPNLMCFFRSCLFWTLPLGWLVFGFNVIALHP